MLIFLPLMVDAYCNWIEVHEVNTAASSVTTDKMQTVFATHGIPELLVTDSGSAFTSAEFSAFLSRNGICHVTSAHYHPATKGLAERAAQTFKLAMKKQSSGSLKSCLARFLFTYRLLPHSTIGRSLAEMLMNRRPHSVLDQLRPDVTEVVRHSQEGQKSHHDSHAHSRVFAISHG